MALTGLIWAAAARVLAELPAQAAAWEDAAGARQRVRAIEARVARLAAGATAIELEVDGRRVRVPAIWPRRLGLFRAGGAGEVSASAVTFLSRAGAQRSVVLASALNEGESSVAFVTGAGCGADAACGIRAGDMVLAVSRDAACGLFRVDAAGARLELAAIMPPAAPVFAPGSVLLPIAVDAISFDAGEGALRRYDGYRSDNVMADGLRAAAVDLVRPSSAALHDGPFAGAGPLAYDVDQLAISGVGLRLALANAARGAAPGASLRWRARPWP